MEIITFRGNKELWNKFVDNLKVNKKEVWEVLEPFIESYSKYEFKRVLQFMQTTLSEYHFSRIIDKIVSAREVSVPSKDFVQIAEHFLIEESFFQDEKEGEPAIHGLGGNIAHGEQDYIIKQILNNEKISKPIKITEKQLTLQFLSEKVRNFIDPIILISTKFVSQLYTDKAANYRLKYGRIEILDNRIKLIFIPESILSNKIIVLESLSCYWFYIKKYNPITENQEILQIEIGNINKDGKTSVLVRTVGKLNINNHEKIKIYEVE